LVVTLAQTFDRGLDLLLLFHEEAPVLSISEIVAGLALPRSTVYRFIRSLRAKGLLESAGRGLYRLGWRTVELGRLAAAPRANLPGVALPVMQELAATTRETIVLTVPRGLRAVCLERVESPEALRLSFTRGVELPIERGASAKVLLAYLDEQSRRGVLDCLAARGGRLDRRALEGELARIRAEGYAMTSEEVDRGARAVAAPVLVADGTLIAGLSVAGPLFRLHDTDLPGLVAAVRAAACEIGARLDAVSSSSSLGQPGPASRNV
jgi:DNA-binding IclR family transcriptional regulator